MKKFNWQDKNYKWLNAAWSLIFTSRDITESTQKNNLIQTERKYLGAFRCMLMGNGNAWIAIWFCRAKTVHCMHSVSSALLSKTIQYIKQTKANDRSLTTRKIQNSFSEEQVYIQKNTRHKTVLYIVASLIIDHLNMMSVDISVLLQYWKSTLLSSIY